MWCLGGTVVEIMVGIFFQHFIEVLMVMNLHQMPVVKPRPLQMLVIGGKAQGLYQMQLNAGSGTETGNIARIAGNFRLD
jgi:hypothetical protein